MVYWNSKKWNKIKQGRECFDAMMALMAATSIAPLAFLLIQPAASLLTTAITRKGQEVGLRPLLVLPLMQGSKKEL